MKYAYCWIRINLSTVEKIRQHESKKSSSTVTDVLGFFFCGTILKTVCKRYCTSAVLSFLSCEQET